MEFSSWLRDVPNDAVSKLPRLKYFSCKRDAISKGGLIGSYSILYQIKRIIF